MKKSIIWLSYDLGIKGDYPGLFTFLDTHNAKECGDGLATFEFEWNLDLESELSAQLKGSISFAPSDRIYLIYRDRKEMKNRGKFIVGKRRVTAPWNGMSLLGVIEEESGE